MPEPTVRLKWSEVLTIKQRARYLPETIFVPSKICVDRVVYVVLNGTVRLSILTRHGKEQVLAYMSRGSIFGEQAALGRKELCANLVVIVDEPSEIAIIPAADFIATLQQRSDSLIELMRISGEKTSLIVQAARRAEFGTVSSRVTSVLAALNRRVGNILISHERLAQLCGTSRVTVAAQLHRLEEEGVICLKRNCIQILDQEHLISLVVEASEERGSHTK
jgi:CRP-like cAMP-binding protein